LPCGKLVTVALIPKQSTNWLISSVVLQTTCMAVPMIQLPQMGQKMNNLWTFDS